MNATEIITAITDEQPSINLSQLIAQLQAKEISDPLTAIRNAEDAGLISTIQHRKIRRGFQTDWAAFTAIAA